MGKMANRKNMMKKELKKKSRKKKQQKNFSFYPTKKIFIYSICKDNKQNLQF